MVEADQVIEGLTDPVREGLAGFLEQVLGLLRVEGNDLFLQGTGNLGAVDRQIVALLVEVGDLAVELV